MLKRLALSCAIGVAAAAAACAPAAPHPWQKEGATPPTVAADMTQCKSLAEQQAARLYPYGSNPSTLGGAGMVAAQQQASFDRGSVQLHLFNECMEGKGYTRLAEPPR